MIRMMGLLLSAWVLLLCSCVNAAERSPRDVSLDFHTLNNQMSEGQIRMQFADVSLQCGNEPSAMGERYCYAYVTRFNEAEAGMVVFFFEKGRLTQMKADVSPAGYADLFGRYKTALGEPRKVPKPERGEQLVAWPLRQGLLVTSQSPTANGKNMFMWISKEKYIKQFLKSVMPRRV